MNDVCGPDIAPTLRTDPHTSAHASHPRPQRGDRSREARRLADTLDRREEFAYFVVDTESHCDFGVVHVGPRADGRPGVELRSWVNPEDTYLDGMLHLAARDWVAAWEDVGEVISPDRVSPGTAQTVTPRPVTVLPEFRFDVAVNRVAVRGHGQAIVTRRDKATVTVHNIDTGLTAAFPAPKPEPYRYELSVTPDLSTAVFFLPHVVRAITPDGTVLREYRPQCGACDERHVEYRPQCTRLRRSAHVSSDGKLVWVHTRTQEGWIQPRAYDGTARNHRLIPEEWLVLDAATGEVSTRTPLRTYAEGSWHVAHPDASRMGLVVGEGQGGVESVWGRWDGERLVPTPFVDGDRGLEAAAPSGDTYLWLSHEDDMFGWSRASDGEPIGDLRADDVLPRHPEAPIGDEDYRPRWDDNFGYLDEHTALVGPQDEHEFPDSPARHYLLDLPAMRLRTRIDYPNPGARGLVAVLGDGRWVTGSGTDEALVVWKLADT